MRLLILALCVSICSATLYHHHHNRRRNMRHKTHHIRSSTHVRNERKAEMCDKNEHHLLCGPERHCDKTCDNMFSPPHCVESFHHAKCYFPRCVCNNGYVRNNEGICIRPAHCPNTYFEPSSMLHETDSNELMVQFEPVKFHRSRPNPISKRFKVKRLSPLVKRRRRQHRPVDIEIRM